MPLASIPWQDVSVVANTNGHSADSGIGTLETLFREDSTQQLAYRTLVSEVLRGKLAWHVTGTDVADDNVPVPVWWDVFVKDGI